MTTFNPMNSDWGIWGSIVKEWRLIRMKGGTSPIVWLALGVIVLMVSGVIQFTGNGIQFSSIGSGGGTTIVPDNAVKQTGGVTCPSTLSTNIRARYTNPLNTSGAAQYVPATTYIIDVESGKQIGTGAGIVSGAYSTIGAVPCGKTYKLVTLGNSSAQGAALSRNVYAESPVFVASNLQTDVDMPVALASALYFKVYNDVNTNMFGNNNWQIDNTSANVTSFASGQSQTWLIRVAPANSSAGYGSTQAGGVVVCANFDTSKYSVDQGVTLAGNGATPIAVPTYCGNLGYDKAWSMNPISAQTDLTFTVKADRGTPTGATGTSPVLYFFDRAGFLSDGSVSTGIADRSDTTVGAVDNNVGIGISPTTA